MERISPNLPSASDGPDWTTQVESILCPLCHYDLRGLSQPRCPECGHQFDWRDLTDPARRLHPYLFEHHPERNLHSFFRTMAGHLLPIRFWRGLRPVMPSNRRRLIGYWMLLLVVVLGALAITGVSTIVKTMVSYHGEAKRLRAYVASPQGAELKADLIRQYGSTEAGIQNWAPPLTSPAFWEIAFREARATFANPLHRLLFLAMGVFCIWPWASSMLMRLFRQSMSQAKLQPDHFLRVFLYSSDVIVLPLAVYTVMNLLEMFTTASIPLYRFWQAWHVYAILYACIIALVVLGYRVIVAYRIYLSFPEAAATVVATQLILFLTLVVAIVYVPGLWKYIIDSALSVR